MEVTQGGYEGNQLSLSVQIVREVAFANWMVVVDLECDHDGSNVDHSYHVDIGFDLLLSGKVYIHCCCCSYHD